MNVELNAVGIFNSAVAAWSIAAAWEIGALDELNRQEYIDLPAFAAKNDVHEPSLRGTFVALASVEIVELDGDVVSRGKLFDDMYESKAFFHWLSRGSSALFTAMPHVLRNANRSGRFYTRDAAAISYACRDINAMCFNPVFWDVMDNLDFPFSKVADLGCGSGERLRQIASRWPGVTGVGVDISEASLGVAQAETESAGLSDRVSFARHDVRALGPGLDLADVDLVTCFLMGHDFWPREECVATLRRLREVFPRARRLILADTTRLTDVPDHRFPMFNLGFELGHDLMGVYLPTLDDWTDVFPESGWRLRHSHQVDAPSGSYLFELA